MCQIDHDLGQQCSSVPLKWEEETSFVRTRTTLETCATENLNSMNKDTNSDLMKLSQRWFAIPLGVLTLMSLFTEPVDWPSQLAYILEIYRNFTDLLFDFTLNWLFSFLLSFKIPRPFVDGWMLCTLAAMTLLRVSDKYSQETKDLSKFFSTLKKLFKIMLTFIFAPIVLAILLIFTVFSDWDRAPFFVFVWEFTLTLVAFLTMVGLFHQSGLLR